MNNRTKSIIKLSFIVLILVVVLAIIIYNSVLIGFQTFYPVRYKDIVEENAAEFQLEEELLYAIINTESGFNKDAVSVVGAKGLTQITPDTFVWLQTKTGESHPQEALFDPEISVYYGAFFIDLLLEEFGDTQTALAAYHAGRGKVNEWLQDPQYSQNGETLSLIPFDDTRNYVGKVMRGIKIYENLYDL